MKKGTYTAGHKPFRIFIGLLFIVGILAFFATKVNSDTITITTCNDELQNIEIVTEALYSPSCFAYYDEDLKRTIVGTIDLSKFNQDTFNECFTFKDNDVQITLEDTTLGEEFQDPKIETRMVYVYDNGNIHASQIEFKLSSKFCVT